MFFQSPQILVVEPDANHRRFLEALLKKAGHGVVLMNNPRQALEKANDTSIGLVLLDLQMPGMNGFQFLKEIRKNRTLPVIVFSKVNRADAAIRAFRLGASDYLIRPLNISRLLSLVQSKMKRAQAPNSIAHYVLVREIGRGGMGVVFEADDVILKRRVALKVLREEFAQDPDYAKQFFLEASAVARLAHPGIVGVFEAGKAGPRLFIAMELVKGHALPPYIGNPVRVLEIGSKIAEALEAAHRAAIIHRDLKPSNIMVTLDGGVKVLDFGLALLSGRSQWKGRIVGTLGYVSPEAILRQKMTPRSDIFSLGVILHEQFTARRAFYAETASELLDKINRRETLATLDSLDHVPASVRDLIYRMMSPDPRARPASMKQVASSLWLERDRLWAQRRFMLHEDRIECEPVRKKGAFNVPTPQVASARSVETPRIAASSFPPA